MAHRVVIVDIDGVLADYVRGVCEVAKRINPDVTVHTEESKPGEPYDSWLGADIDAVWAELDKDKHTFWWDLKPIPDEHERWRLAHLEADKYYVTARTGETAKEQTERWLIHHGFERRPTVVVSQSLTAKWMVAHAIGATHVIDDRISALSAYLANPAGFRVYGRRWRSNSHWESGAVRWVTSLDQFITDVEGS